jgi:hypothetical protein
MKMSFNEGFIFIRYTLKLINKFAENTGFNKHSYYVEKQRKYIINKY